MSDTKFTKGDWNIKTKGHYFDGGRQYKHEVLVNDTGVTCFDRAMANANLIKTSPKMYEMLESVIGELHMLIDEVNEQRASKINSQTETEPDYHDMETIHDIQVLLAEARGEL